MPTQESQFTTIAGEHYVAHKLAMLGFVPAIVRQGVRSMDLIVSSQDGSRTVPVQVESAASALRDCLGRDAEKSLQFPLSQRSLEQAADSTLFCFVDLRVRHPQQAPDVYIMTAAELRQEAGTARLRKYSYLRYVRPASSLARFRNNWAPFFAALSAPARLEPELEVTAPGLRTDSPMWGLVGNQV